MTREPGCSTRWAPTEAFGTAIRVELDVLTDTLDAVGDLLMAEAVHQAVLGNSERAAAALDALDRQGPIPDISVVRTPRTGTSISHRVIVELGRDRPDVAWRRRSDIRSTAEPRVDAWVASVLGDPAGYRFAAEVVVPGAPDPSDPDAGVTDQVVDTVTVTLADLGMSALSSVASIQSGDKERTEFEHRLELEFLAAASLPDGARLRPLPGPGPDAPAGTVGLADFLATAAATMDLLGSARPADVADLAHPSVHSVTGVDVAELSGRVDAVAAAVDAIASVDPATLGGFTDAALADLIEGAAELGIRGTIPTSGERVHLEQIAASAIGQAMTRAAHAAEHDGHAGGDGLNAVRALLAQMGALLGAHIPIVPLVDLSDSVSGPIDLSAADPATTGSDPLAAATWLHRHAPVRPGVERLWVVLADAESRGVEIDPTQLVPVQLPHRPGAEWVGLDQELASDAADTSIVMLRAPDRRKLVVPFAGLVVDQWAEQVPGDTEATGVSFHFDAPARGRPRPHCWPSIPTPKPNDGANRSCSTSSTRPPASLGCALSTSTTSPPPVACCPPPTWRSAWSRS